MSNTPPLRRLRSKSRTSQYISAQSSTSMPTPIITPPPTPPGVQFVPNPMQIQQKSQTTKNGMTAYFRSLTKTNKVIKKDFDFVQGFRRAVKVFVMSYPEIIDSIPITHSRKLQEYVQEMSRLYNIKSPDMSFLSKLYKKAPKEMYNILITCKRVVGRDRLTNPQLVCTLKQKVFNQTIDVLTEEQPYAPTIISLKFSTFAKLRSDANRRIVLTIEEGDSAQPQQEMLKQFDLIVANTHPEGFEDWVDFGRGVRLLISVIYKVKDEHKMTAEEVSTFHMKTIELMLRKRLYENQTKIEWTHLDHQANAMKFNVNYQRRYVNPQMDNYFWIKPKFGRTPDWFQPSDRHINPRNRQTVVKFIDMQIGFETNEEFEDSVCLCNEWCNWNAFFYYNPIYRFLLVRHHQLYIKNMSNIPDMYLCLTVLFSCGAGASAKVPVFQLMSCANDYRKRYYDNFYLKSSKSLTFQKFYEMSEPSAPILNGLTYNKLRDELDVTKLCHYSDPNPFSDNCINNLIRYYNVLMDIHQRLSSNKRFVLNKRHWADELDTVGRNKYTDFIKQSYDKCIAQVLIGYDFLFTVDYEYSSKLAQTSSAQNIREIREQVMSKLTDDSLFNVRVTLNPFLNAFASISKFLAKVDPILPLAHEVLSRSLLMSCYVLLDVDFGDYINANMTFDFQLNPKTIAFKHLQQNFEVFYTLKLYFFAFEIQKHCINALIQYNRRLHYKTDQLCELFRFIWINEMVEQKYRNSYPGEVLFDSPDFMPVFNEFYDQFWGSARHERTVLTNIVDNIESAHFEYQRLYFWLKNNGNKRRKFVKIIDSLNDCLLDIRNRSEEIFDIKIVLALGHLPPTYVYSAEVFDHLVYYLVKANCSVILSSVAKFFQSMHALQLDDLVSRGMSFSMCKPGWVHLFKTLDIVLSALDDLHTHYIQFDDEFERISNICLQTKQMIKDIYRQFYSKLSYEWLDEMKNIFDFSTYSLKIAQFLVLHLAVGLAFITVFCDTFRCDFAYSRKKMFFQLRRRFNQNLQHQVQFTRCIRIVNNYLVDRQLIAEGNPFGRDPWLSYLYNITLQFNQKSAQQLRIDLNASNV